MSLYQFSEAVTNAELERWSVFTTLDVRKHKQEHLAHQGSQDFMNDMATVLGDNVRWKCCSQPAGHFTALSILECLPDRLGLISGTTDMMFLMDDIFENTTDSQRTKGTLEGSEGFQSVLERKGLPSDTLGMFLQLKDRFMEYVTAGDPRLALWMSQEVGRVATAPPSVRMNHDTIESYMKVRLHDVATKWYFELCAYGKDLELHETEKEQASRPARAIEKAIIYTNDFYSWAKEEAEQASGDASKDIFNAVAILMKEHKITEANALDMVRQRTRKFIRILHPPLKTVAQNDGSSDIGIGHLMTGDDPQDGRSAVPEANRKEGGRPRPVDGPLESHQSGDTCEEPGTEILLALYEHVAVMPTEKVHDVFIDGLNSWLQLPEKSLNRIRSIVVKLYTAALMLGDVEGGSILRRGMPSAQIVYGASQTINSAGYVQICVFAEAAGLSNPGAVSIVCEELTNLYKGQSMELFWKFHTHCPTEEEYYEMVDGKTGGFFRLILRLMQAESPALKSDLTSPLPSAPLPLIPARAFEPALETFITSLGRYFQVRNEYENLASSKDVHRERFYEDLDEGKMSLPVIHSLQNSSGGDKARIKGIFKTRGPSGPSPEVKEFVIKHLSVRTASLPYVRDILKGLASAIADALAALEEIFGIQNPLLRGVMAKLEG